MEKEKKQGKKTGIIAAVIVIALLVGAAGLYFSGALGGTKGGEITTISESTLKEVIEISELSNVIKLV